MRTKTCNDHYFIDRENKSVKTVGTERAAKREAKRDVTRTMKPLSKKPDKNEATGTKKSKRNHDPGREILKKGKKRWGNKDTPDQIELP